MYVYMGRTYGRTKKDAEKRFRQLYPREVRGKKLSLVYTNHDDPPFKLFDVYFESDRKDVEKNLSKIEYWIPYTVEREKGNRR